MKNINNILRSFILFVVVCISLTACKTDEIGVYNAKQALFFPRLNPTNTKIIIDSINVSFTHYPGAEELEIPFRVSLIGTSLLEDLQYSVSVVEERTTAPKDSYDFPKNPIFRKDMSHDTLWIKIKRANLGDKELLLVVKINENENFEQGFFNNVTARLAFNDIKSKPAWWNADIINNYFGTYSFEKYETIIKAANEEGIIFTSTEGLTPTEKREIAIITKDYIAKNGITELSGEDMIIIAY